MGYFQKLSETDQATTDEFWLVRLFIIIIIFFFVETFYYWKKKKKKQPTASASRLSNLVSSWCRRTVQLLQFYFGSCIWIFWHCDGEEVDHIIY